MFALSLYINSFGIIFKNFVSSVHIAELLFCKFAQKHKFLNKKFVLKGEF